MTSVWIFMGAAAICVFAGVRLLGLPPGSLLGPGGLAATSDRHVPAYRASRRHRPPRSAAARARQDRRAVAFHIPGGVVADRHYAARGAETTSRASAATGPFGPSGLPLRPAAWRSEYQTTTAHAATSSA